MKDYFNIDPKTDKIFMIAILSLLSLSLVLGIVL